MNFQCPKCKKIYEVDEQFGGHIAFCPDCQTEVILPIPDPDRLLCWAQTTSWDLLWRFIKESAARGHTTFTVDKLIRIYEKRRAIEEERSRAELAKSRGKAALSQRERIWANTENRLQKKQTLRELRQLDPGEFEQFVAMSFIKQGYDANTCGGPNDNGIDVDIRTKSGKRWAIAQCKRYGDKARIGSHHVRDFCGAFVLSKAERGFIFTTGQLTRQARTTALEYPWLTIYSGSSLAEYFDKLCDDNATSEKGITGQ